MKAITRAVSSAMQECELTHMAREPIDVARARLQHENYNRALRDLGVQVTELKEEAELPDSVFVEDTAIVFDELAVISLPGAPSRRPETASIATALTKYRKLASIEPPAILDGGDVLTVGKAVFVGLSSRSNAEAVRQLQHHLSHFGYQVHGLEMGKCLHLKTAVTALDEDTVLINPDWIDAAHFSAYEVIPTHTDEPFAANVVRLPGAILYGASFPKTQASLEAKGYRIHTVDMSELAKAEGAVTCCSLLIND